MTNTLLTIPGGATDHPRPPSALRREGHSWAPFSPCTPDCLPAEGSLPRVSRARVAARVTGTVFWFVCSAGLALLLPVLSTGQRAWAQRRVFTAMTGAMGVRLVHSGAARFDAGLDGGVLVVANHLSWIDVLGLSTVQPLRIIAKTEIREWPVIGGLIARFGTLFVDRSELRSLPTVVAGASAALADGGVVGLFPEGTTWCGAAFGVFRRAGFQAALDAGVPVRPVALRMRLPDGTPTSVGSFIGDDTLCASLVRVARLPELVLEVEVLPVLETGPETDRRELARRAELVLAEATGAPAPPAPVVPRRHRRRLRVAA
ncbi:lysophospholipid acyltransferase family protein [Pseudonocardia eucalypti]|uniref:Lysophospholipid acyltransferase family protein n=1 Tax=Pseudonocardia eucalypti TaxID=648755 RepID=A0ABP9QCA4_9PSEU|nr:1-acyl-sn-glycerol-3-phosphate acyltransferase [Pseudonocardia eucalypti]